MASKTAKTMKKNVKEAADAVEKTADKAAKNINDAIDAADKTAKKASKQADKAARTIKGNVKEAREAAEDRTQKTNAMLRRAALAYLGMYGVAYEEAQARLNNIRENSDGWFNRLVKKGEEIEAQAADLFEDAQERVSENAAKVRDALKIDPNVVDIRVRTKKATAKKPTAKATVTLKTKESAAKKTTAKKQTAKKPAAKKAVAKKPVAKKTAAKKPVAKKATPKKAPAKKAPAKKPVAKKAAVKANAKTAKATKPAIASAMSAKAIEKDERYEGYVSNVRTYDKSASAVTIKKIVDHCGIALTNQDGRFVACSDESERNTVRDSWLKKHLGVTGKAVDLDAKVMAVCETMANDRMKDRVTFYYLLAKQERKLSAI